MASVLDPLQISPTSSVARGRAEERQRGLLKPLGALGRLEALAVQYCAVTTLEDTPPDDPALAIAVFAADHGVAVEGVSAYPASVTATMVKVMVEGRAAISVLARSHGIALSVTDVGVANTIDLSRRPGYFAERVREGTRNITREAAMTPDEVERAMAVGMRRAREAVAHGASVLGLGEVGIGNTTSAAALVCGLTGLSPTAVVGRGTGIDDVTYARKVEVVTRALDRHHGASRKPFDALAALGGLELAAMVGFMLAAAESRCVVVLDGFMSSAAALVASGLFPDVRDYFVASHVSAERGAHLALQALDLAPVLSLEMRLGEGTGAALAMSLIRDAVRLEREMGTFVSEGLV